jgi:hypothetical protein
VVHLVGRRDSLGCRCREDLRWGFAAPIWACRPRSYRSGSWAPLGVVRCVTSEAAKGRQGRLTAPWRRIATSSHIYSVLLCVVDVVKGMQMAEVDSNTKRPWSSRPLSHMNKGCVTPPIGMTSSAQSKILWAANSVCLGRGRR